MYTSRSSPGATLSRPCVCRHLRVGGLVGRVNAPVGGDRKTRAAERPTPTWQQRWDPWPRAVAQGRIGGGATCQHDHTAKSDQCCANEGDFHVQHANKRLRRLAPGATGRPPVMPRLLAHSTANNDVHALKLLDIGVPTGGYRTPQCPGDIHVPGAHRRRPDQDVAQGTHSAQFDDFPRGKLPWTASIPRAVPAQAPRRPGPEYCRASQHRPHGDRLTTSPCRRSTPSAITCT